MKNIFLLPVIFLLIFFLAFDLKPTKKPIFIKKINEKKICTDKPLPNFEIPKGLTSFSAEATIDLKLKIITTQLQAKVYYEKPLNFRLLVTRGNKKELDLGSNSTEFWYWSRKDDPKKLNYGKHSEVEKMRLKAPLNPLWIMESFGFNGFKGYQVTETKNNYMLSKMCQAAEGTLKKVLIIEKDRMVLIGNYLFDQETVIASTECQEFQKINGYLVPKRMLIIWPTEGMELQWTFFNVKLDEKLNTNLWVKPSFKHSVDLNDGLFP